MKKTLFLVLLLVLPFVFASSPPSAAFPKEILFFDRLNADEIQIKPIENPEIRINSIGLTTNSLAFRSRITVQAMPDCPENAPYQTNLLQCFYTTSQNLEGKIKQLEIHFKVPKEWIEANEFSKVELKRYSYSWNEGGLFAEWSSLDTKKEKEDENYFHYVAYSDGTDYFSIVGMKTGRNEVYVKELKQENIAQEIAEEKDSEIKKETSQEEIKPVQQIPSNQVTGSAIIEFPNPSTAISFLVLTIIVAGIILVPLTGIKKEENHFEKLVNYIEESRKNNEEVFEKLKNKGWEDWQIELAFKEINERE